MCYWYGEICYSLEKEVEGTGFSFQDLIKFETLIKKDCVANF